MRQALCAYCAVLVIMLALCGGCGRTVSVTRTVPEDGALAVEPGSVICVEFARPVPRAEIERGFSVEPEVVGTFSWEGRTLIFWPAGTMTEGTLHRVVIRHSILPGGEYRFAFSTAFAPGQVNEKPDGPPPGERLDLRVGKAAGTWRVGPPAAEEEFAGSVTWLPDSSGLIFLLLRKGEKVAGLLDLESATVTRVFSLPEGPEFVYMSGALGERRGAIFLVMPPEGAAGLPTLWHATLEGSQKIVRQGVSHFALSPEGRRVIVFRLDGNGGVPEMVDFATGKEIPLASVPAYDWPYTAVGLAWSPDGNLVAGERWQRHVSIYVVDARTGRLLREIAGEGEFYFYAQWATDSRHLAFLATPTSEVVWSGWDEWPLPIAAAIGIVEIASGRVSFVAAPEGRVVDVPVWSPQGSAFAFASGTVEKGREAPFGQGSPADISELWLCSLEGRKPVLSRLTDETSGKGSKRVAAWLPGGKEIIFRVGNMSAGEPHAGELWAVDVGSGAQRRLALDESERIQVLPDGTLVTIARAALVRFDPATQAKEVLARGISSLNEFTVSPDGRFVQYFSDGARQELVVMQLAR